MPEGWQTDRLPVTLIFMNVYHYSFLQMCSPRAFILLRLLTSDLLVRHSIFAESLTYGGCLDAQDQPWSRWTVLELLCWHWWLESGWGKLCVQEAQSQLLRESEIREVVKDCSSKEKPSRKFRKLCENSVWVLCLVLDGCKWSACRGQCSFFIPSFPLCARSGWGWLMRTSRWRFEEPIWGVGEVGSQATWFEVGFCFCLLNHTDSAQGCSCLHAQGSLIAGLGCQVWTWVGWLYASQLSS